MTIGVEWDVGGWDDREYQPTRLMMPKGRESPVPRDIPSALAALSDAIEPRLGVHVQ